MVVSTRVNGKTIKCMVKEFTNGQMEESMTESISMIRSMDLESTVGLMERSTKENGIKGSSMERDSTLLAKMERLR